MQIRVKCGCDAKACPEWAIVELQGVVESQPSIGNQIQDLEIGRLCCTSQVSPQLNPHPPPRSSLINQWLINWFLQGSYTFTVGYHELSGTKMPLKKPIVILRKRKIHIGKSEDLSRTELEVVGIIRHRILFKNRPKALISSRFFFFFSSWINFSW